ncbi:hypothetical protein FG379_001978 [Cryptosporidium bovis]|uniref:uncharacterized protein n=1 Tax=Cryptosporidium bovis TaxID=310047 RepID=UPI00351A6FA7|nr:hypothetical protein FG379_001978 [Cryptosporidium bovis]
MFETHKQLLPEMVGPEPNKLILTLNEASIKNNQLIHGVNSNLNVQINRHNSSGGTNIIRKPYNSKTPIHRQKPRHVPSFCSFSDSKNNFEKELLEKISTEKERNIIFSYYEPGTIGLRRYAVTHQDEVDGYIFDFSKRSTRLSNDTMDRTVITVGFTGRKKRWTLCPSCDCIPKADKREKIVGQWKILHLPPKGGSLVVPRCVYEAYGDVVDDCNYFAATLCPQQTYCAKHSNQTSFLNRNWHYSYRHQFALQDYIVFCDNLQSVRVVWKLLSTKESEISPEITAELAEKTLISVMQRFLEFTKMTGTKNLILPVNNTPISSVNENSEESTPLSMNMYSFEKDERSNPESQQSAISNEPIFSQLDLSKLQIQFVNQIAPNNSFPQIITQQNSNMSVNPVFNPLIQKSSYIHDFLNYLDNTKKLETNPVEKSKKVNHFQRNIQNIPSPSLKLTDNLNNFSVTGTTPISMDYDTNTSLQTKVTGVTLSTEDNISSGKIETKIEGDIQNLQSTSVTNPSINDQNAKIDFMDPLRNNTVPIGPSLQGMCGINQALGIGNYTQLQIPQLINSVIGSSNQGFLYIAPNSSLYPFYVPINNYGVETRSLLSGANLVNQKNETNSSIFSLNSNYTHEI